MISKKRHILKAAAKIPVGIYCYSQESVCPYFWNNPLGYGDCSYLVPKWKFWRWNGWKDYDPALDDQCKACDVNELKVTDKKSRIFVHLIVGWKNGKPLIKGHNNKLIHPEEHEVYKNGYEIDLYDS